MKRYILLAAFLLAGCATPAPKIVTRDVLVPTPVRCIDKDTIPAEPGEVTLSADARVAADQAAAQAKTLRAWGRSLYAMIVPACTR